MRKPELFSPDYLKKKSRKWKVLEREGTSNCNLWFRAQRR